MMQEQIEHRASANESYCYPRRILLAVTGLSPQIVTETLYALWRSNPGTLPTEVHLITTATGADHARLNLLSPAIGWLERLRREYDLPPIRFAPSHIHVIPGRDGERLDDIRTPDENVCAADFITDLVRRLTAQEDSALHVSIAGGRKSMGYFVGYALSLFGRPQDRLSHVLVSAPFESHPEFYYPTLTEHPIHVGPEGKKIAYDCRTAKVDLAWIPFVRLRSAHHRPLVEGNARFSDCVSAVQEALAEHELILDLQGKRICAGGQIIRLPPTELAFLSWFARRAQAGLPPLPGITFKDPEGRGADYRAQFIAELERIDPLLDEDSRTLRAAGLRDGMLPDYFNTKNSTLNRMLRDKVGALAARPYLVLQEPDGSGYALALPPEAIRYAPLPTAKPQRSR
ncbi:CRISPR-associated protein, NE0113 family [Thiorhodococcus drewsii AZ1]|uniref:CRISPR-associated protein, NE0113 family n=2 Tax=Thiorhodococcus drewsii TaxID=210408 RepID=G2DYL0_9GAMM|nr:CRISPR-associated protein, NE0113 family [Thiorhodococcus drewsii AZ1]